jgi:hypothetical protein
MATTLRALCSFTAPGRISIQEGDIVSSDNPVVEGRMELFEAVEDFIARVEMPVKKAPAKKASAKPAA